MLFYIKVYYLEDVGKMFSCFLENVIMMLWKHQKFTVFKDVLKTF